MSYTLTVPVEYGYILFQLSLIVAVTKANPFSSYVVMTAALSTFLGTWHGFQTAKFRRAAKVKCKFLFRH